MKSLWPVFGLLLAMSCFLPFTPAECIILWTGELFRGWLRVLVYTSQPTFYYSGIEYPPHDCGNTRPVIPKPTALYPFWQVSRGVTPGRPKTVPKPTSRPMMRKPTKPKPVVPKPTKSKPMIPKPTTPKPMLPRPATTRITVPKRTTLKPGGTTKSTTTTPEPMMTKTTLRTSTEEPTETNLIPETAEMTKGRFYNMTCGKCPPKKQCLCPGVHF